jgi:hypothetical protein
MGDPDFKIQLRIGYLMGLDLSIPNSELNTILSDLASSLNIEPSNGKSDIQILLAIIEEVVTGNSEEYKPVRDFAQESLFSKNPEPEDLKRFLQSEQLKNALIKRLQGTRPTGIRPNGVIRNVWDAYTGTSAKTSTFQISGISRRPKAA